MALHWEEARVIVTCGNPRELGEVPDDVIVIAVKPEEVEDPDAIESVRNLVLDRTIEWRKKVINEAYELGTSMPDPLVEDSDGLSGEAADAERSLLEALREREDDVEDEGDDVWGDPYRPLSESGLWLGGEPGGGVRIEPEPGGRQRLAARRPSLPYSEEVRPCPYSACSSESSSACTVRPGVAITFRTFTRSSRETRWSSHLTERFLKGVCLVIK